MIEQDANSMISACGILGADGLEHVAVFLQAMLMMELELETLKLMWKYWRNRFASGAMKTLFEAM